MAPGGRLDEKQRLRRRMKARRAALSASERAQAARAVIEPVRQVLAAQKAQTVGLYYPLADEFDALPLARALWRDGLELALPIVLGAASPLVFRPWRAGDILERGACNIMIPPDKGLRVCPDALIIPLLGFDESGARLGYGGGYYDRTLEGLRREKKVAAIGLAHDFQRLEELPTEPHDQPLDGVITPSGVHWFG